MLPHHEDRSDADRAICSLAAVAEADVADYWKRISEQIGETDRRGGDAVRTDPGVPENSPGEQLNARKWLAASSTLSVVLLLARATGSRAFRPATSPATSTTPGSRN